MLLLETLPTLVYLDEESTLEDLQQAVNSMADNKATGEDRRNSRVANPIYLSICTASLYTPGENVTCPKTYGMPK